MWKILSALNLIGVIFISACSNNFKEYNLQFASIKNSGLILIPKNYDMLDFNFNFTKSNILLPNFSTPQKQFYVYNSEFTNLYNKNGVYKKINGYLVDSSTYDVRSYWLDEIVNVKILFKKVSGVYRITSFSAEMPNKN